MATFLINEAQASKLASKSCEAANAVFEVSTAIQRCA